MKKRKASIVIFVSLLFLLGVAASAAGKSTKALQAYEKILHSSSYDGIKTECFALLDINQDGVKELLVSNARNKINLYGYDGTKVKCLYRHATPVRGEFGAYYLAAANYRQAGQEIEHDTLISYSKSKKRICFETNPVNESYGRKSTFLTLSSSTKANIVKIELKLERGGDPYKVYINGKVASKSKWGSYVNWQGKAVNPGTAVKFYKNTSSNRKSCGIIAANTSSGNKKDQNARINRTSGKVCIGKTLTLSVSGNASKVKWSSSNTKVATVSSKGVVKAKKTGKAVITATVGKRKLKCTITVQKPASIAVSSVSLSQKSLSLTKGKVYTLTAKIWPLNATNKAVAWSSSDRSVVSVSGGRITALKAGTAIIKVRTNNGKYATCKVTVKNPAANYIPYISLTKRISSGNSMGKIDATTFPHGAAVTWHSSNTNIVSVDSYGNVRANGNGKATITASISAGGKTYSKSIELTAASRVSYGAWSNWTTQSISSTSYQQVETTALYRYYCFYCPVCGGREPFQGRSDCHKYTLTMSDGRIIWSPIPYYRSNPQGYRYTSAKYYTESLGDGQRWNFSAGNLNDNAIGTVDAAGPVTAVITRGYRSRSVSYTNYFV